MCCWTLINSLPQVGHGSFGLADIGGIGDGGALLLEIQSLTTSKMNCNSKLFTSFLVHYEIRTKFSC